MTKSPGEGTAPADPVAARPARLLRMMLVEVGLPVLAYYGLHAAGVSDYRALLAATLVAGLRVAFVAVRNRRLDGFAAFLMVLFAVGLALSFVTGDARFLLAKDSIGTAVAGLIFLGTCVVGRPMTFYAAQRFAATTAEKRAWWNTRWQTTPAFRRGFRVMSVIWGVGLLLEAAVRIPLIYVLPIDIMVGLSTVLQVAALTLIMTWNVWYGRRMQRSAVEMRSRTATTSGTGPADS
ncbi:MAG TPA: VC0807 family protein [Pseudonocardiaceae bacterium]|nr:VC0807 family protein [Pseudonocardiaceae bacterium]